MTDFPGDIAESAPAGWEQRWHPLRREWVVYSAHRNQRPWQGETSSGASTAPAYEKRCYLCPGNTRISGLKNPSFDGVYVFDNDHPVVGADAPAQTNSSSLYLKRPADGVARVIVYDPRHHISISDLTHDQVTNILLCWQEQTRDMQSRDGIDFCLFFENRGDMVGTSSPHPHCQMYATNFCFKHVEDELDAAHQFRNDHKANLFEHILNEEKSDGSRLIAENEHAVAFIPFFARYSYEVWIFPKQRHASLLTLSREECAGLSDLYRDISIRYDLLYGIPFPYVMSVYQAPFSRVDDSEFHLHLVFLPPLRQPGVRKFPAGPEIGGGNFMCDTIPEQTAADLKKLNSADYSCLT